MNDDERIEAWRSRGNGAALQGLLEPHEAGIFAFMMRMLCQRQDAEDATQLAFSKAVAAIGEGQYQARGSFKSWLFQIACNEARGLLRKRKRRSEVGLEGGMGEEQRSWDPPDMQSLTPMDELVRGERVAALKAAVERLPQAEREVVALRLQLDCTFAEIAEITATPLGTVLGRMRNATRRLRRDLENRQ